MRLRRHKRIDADALWAEVVRLQGMLCSFGGHDPRCYVWRDPTESCTCGFAQVTQIRVNRDGGVRPEHSDKPNPVLVTPSAASESGRERMADPQIPEGAYAVVTSPAGTAYRGKENCTNIMCTRMGLDSARCYGWHCAACHGPANSQGDCSNCRRGTKAKPKSSSPKTTAVDERGNTQ